MRRTNLDLTGERFGRLVVIGKASVAGGRTTYWHCRCDCGCEKNISTGNMARTTSCGCYLREVITKHAGYGTPEYGVWKNILQRTSNPNHPQFQDWGGRGIRNKFASFSDFIACVGKRPFNHMTIDRIDNDGHYEPGNVRWATRLVQSNNRRNTRVLTAYGITKSATEWARAVGINKHTLTARLSRGLTPEQAMPVYVAGI